MPWVVVAGVLTVWGAPHADTVLAPDIRGRLRRATLERVLNDKEVSTSAKLESEGPEAFPPGTRSSSPFTSQMPPLQRYEFHTVMRVGAPLQRVREVVMDPRVYVKIVPYVTRAEFDAARGELHVVGGIWRYQLQSTVRFQQRSPRWIHYRIVEGHFEGLEGDFTFEPLGEKGTLVAFRGGVRGQKFPPRFVAEEGAQIVFAYTARRMRTYIESQEGIAPGRSGDEKSKFPEPRRRIQR